MFKGFLIAAIISCSTLCGSAQTYELLDSGSSVRFEVRNFGLSVVGSLRGLEGKVFFSEDEVALSQFKAKLKAGTIDTGIGLRDKHLRKEDYFDVEKYPLLEFSSVRVFKNQDSAWTITGLLSIKGVTREVSFPFRFSPHSQGYRFSGKFKINRKDFDVGESSFSLSDEVVISLDVIARRSSIIP